MKRRHVIPTRTSRRAWLLGVLGAVTCSPVGVLLVSLASAGVAIVWAKS